MTFARFVQLGAVALAALTVTGSMAYGVNRGLQTSEMDMKVAACERHLGRQAWQAEALNKPFNETEYDQIQDNWTGRTFGGRECTCEVFTEMLRRHNWWWAHIGCKRT